MENGNFIKVKIPGWWGYVFNDELKVIYGFGDGTISFYVKSQFVSLKRNKYNEFYFSLLIQPNETYICQKLESDVKQTLELKGSILVDKIKKWNKEYDNVIKPTRTLNPLRTRKGGE